MNWADYCHICRLFFLVERCWSGHMGCTKISFSFFSLAFIRKYWVDLFFQQTCSQIENLALDWTLQILLVCIYVCFFFIWKNNFPNVGVSRAVSL